jgi:O-antigen ligase
LDFKLSGLHIPLLLSSICLMLAFVSGLQRALSTTPMRLLLGFTFWMLLSIPFSVWRGGSIELFKDIWIKSLMAGFIVAALINSTGQAVRIAKTLAFAFLAAGLLGLVYGESQEGRLMLSQGSYQNPNDYAIAILYGCICWYFMLHNPRSSFFVRGLSLLVLPFLLLMLLKTGSRGALLTAFLTFIPIFWRYSMMVKAAIVLLLPIVAAGALLLLPPEIRSRYLTVFSQERVEKAQSMKEQELLASAVGSSEQRLQLLKDAARLTLQNPLFGVGPGMFSVAQNDISVERGQRRGAWLGTHNTYLQVSSEIGIPGLLLFLAILFHAWKNLRALEHATASRRDDRALEIQTLAFTLRLLLLSSFTFFFFEHIPFSPFVPVLTCWITSFALSARQELTSQFASNAAAIRRAPLPVMAAGPR